MSPEKQEQCILEENYRQLQFLKALLSSRRFLNIIESGCTRARRRTIKFHFYQANVFELAIKQRFSPDNEATPHRGVGSFSFFVYSPANWFCGIRFSSSSTSSSTSSSPPRSRRRRLLVSGGPGYFGVRKYRDPSNFKRCYY